MICFGANFYSFCPLELRLQIWAFRRRHIFFCEQKILKMFIFFKNRFWKLPRVNWTCRKKSQENFKYFPKSERGDPPPGEILWPDAHLNLLCSTRPNTFVDELFVAKKYFSRKKIRKKNQINQSRRKIEKIKQHFSDMNLRWKAQICNLSQIGPLQKKLAQFQFALSIRYRE